MIFNVRIETETYCETLKHNDLSMAKERKEQKMYDVYDIMYVKLCKANVTAW